MRGYKLLTLRKDGTLGPLFINRKQVIPVGKWIPAEDHPTKGYARRPGWHACEDAEAPHLTMKGRVWCAVELRKATKLKRPEAQGTTWYLAQQMRITSVHPELRHRNRFDIRGL